MNDKELQNENIRENPEDVNRKLSWVSPQIVKLSFFQTELNGPDGGSDTASYDVS